MVQPTPGSRVTPLGDGLSLTARYTMQGNSAATWFGPLAPMQPVAPKEVAGRIYDFPAGVNLTQQPRAYENVSFAALRAIADAYDLLRLAIETRKDQMGRLAWKIIPRKTKYGVGKQQPPQKLLDRCTELELFFRQPCPGYDWEAWLRELLEDLFVIDAPTLYRRRTRGGALLGLEPIDGATIIRRIDPWGRTPLPPDPAYQQQLKGMPAVDYTTRDIIYRPRNRRTWKMYGYSPTEQVLVTVNIALRRQVYQLQYYTEGNIPEALIGVPETWTPDQIEAFQKYWDAILEGNTAQRRHAKFVPGGVAKTFIPTKEPELKNEFDEWLARVICYAFSLPPTAFVKQMNRATAQSAKETGEEEGLAPIQMWAKGTVDQILIEDFQEADCEFAWDEDVELDPQVQAEIIRDDVKAGLLSIDEGRAMKGELPLPNGAGSKPMVLTATGYIPVDINADMPTAGEDAQQKADAAQAIAEATAKAPAVTPPVEGPSGKAPPKDGQEKAPPVEGEEPQAKAEKLAKSARRYKTYVPTGKGRKAIRAVKAKFKAALASAGKAVAEKVRTELGKASSDAKRAKRIADAADLSALADAGEAASDYLADAATEGGVRAVTEVGLNGEDLFDHINERAVDYAERRSAELVSQVDDTTREDIRRTISDGLDAGKTADEIAADVEAATGFSAERAELIAMTEIANSNSMGTLIGYSVAQENGVKVRKVWLLGEGACEVCEENADEGPIELDEEFPSGDMAPTAHPNCRCSLGNEVEEGPTPSDEEED